MVLIALGWAQGLRKAKVQLLPNYLEGIAQYTSPTPQKEIMNELELGDALSEFESRISTIENSLISAETISELRYRVTLLEGLLKEKPITPKVMEDILKVARDTRNIALKNREMVQTFLKERKPSSNSNIGINKIVLEEDFTSGDTE